jgi:WD40 repeat protein
MLLTTGHEGSVRAWQLPSGKVVWEKRAGTARISELAFAPNGQRFAMAGTDGLVRVWETESGKQLFERRVPGQCLCVAYGPKGYRFAVGDTGGNLWLFGAEEGEQLVLLACDHGCPVEGVAFAPDAKTLVTCGGRGRVRLWDLQSNTLLRNLDCEDVRVWCVTFSPDNRAIVCGAADGAIRTWNTANANAARFLPAAAGNGGPSIAFSPDGRTLAVAAPDGSVSFWDPATCQRRTAMESLQLDKPGRHLVRYQPSGAGLGTCGPDGSLQSWGQDGRLSGQLPGSGSAGLSLCCRPGTSEWLSRRGDGPPVLWDAASGRRLPWKHGDEPCSAAAWSADGSMLALAYPRRVKLIRTGSRDPLEFVLPERASDVTAVAFSPDGSTLAAAEFGGIIRLCDTAGGKVLRVLEGRQLGVEGLAFSPAGNILATGDREGRVKVWYVASGRELFNLAAHRGSRICELAFAPDGSSLAAACVDHNGADEVALWPASAP